MYEVVKECPVCQNEKLENNMVCQDYSVSGESFMIVKCNNCLTKITSPRPVQNVIENYYASDNYISHTNKANNIINTLYKIVRKYTIKQKVSLINKFSKKGKILDIGCGTGEFLKACLKNGWEITAIEPNENAWENSVINTNNNFYKDVLSLKNKNTYDVITLWHVFEHLYNPNEIIKKLKSLIKDEGVIILAVPNYESYDAQHYKEFWAGYDVPRHLYHFSQSSIKTLIKQHNLKLKKILPMYFDSYYVSILSEQNKNGKSNLIHAFINGLKSNIKARKKKNYSSLIYIIQSKKKKKNEKN